MQLCYNELTIVSIAFVLYMREDSYRLDYHGSSALYKEFTLFTVCTVEGVTQRPAPCMFASWHSSLPQKGSNIFC